MSKKTILKPVKPEDYKVQFGGTLSKNGFNPSEHYAATICEFKKFAVGRFFWFIADAKNGIAVDAGGQMETMMPFGMDDFLHKPPHLLFASTDPEDLPQMFAFTNHWVSFFLSLPEIRRVHVRPSIYLRMMNPAKQFAWVMIQYGEPVINETGEVAFGITFITDISHIKKEGKAAMSILDTYDDTCQQFICADGQTLSNGLVQMPKISKRELGILKMLSTGYSSKQMADELSLSIKTVDNHRQNLLRKASCKTSSELTNFGIKMGLV